MQSYLFVRLSLFVVRDSDPPLVYAEQKNKCEKCGEAASLSEPITGLRNVQDDDVKICTPYFQLVAVFFTTRLFVCLFLISDHVGPHDQLLSADQLLEAGGKRP